MILAMDGVVRRNGFTPVITAAPIRSKPDRENLVRPLAAGARLDGLGRVSTPSPRELLTQLHNTPSLETTTQALVSSGVITRSPWVMPQLPYLRPAAITITASAILLGGGALASTALGHSSMRLTTSKTRLKPVAAQKALASAPNSASSAAAAAAAAVQTQSTALQQLVTNFASANASQYGISVTDLKTGATATLNADRSTESASLYKLFVADRIYAGIDLGTYNLSDAAGGGSGLNISSCLTYMITISDNTCGRALGQIIGWGDQNATLAQDGYTGTNMTGPYQQTSAHDIALLFQRLYLGTLNSPASNTAFLNLLKDQQVNNRLPVGLPDGTVIAHKTGDLDGYMHDAGIIYGPKTNYLVVMMGQPGTTATEFSTLSSQLWNFFEQ